MAANRRLPTEFYPPIGEQETTPIIHRNVGNAKAPDHTLNPGPTYPNRKSRNMVMPSQKPQWTTLYTSGRQRILTPYKVPTGRVATGIVPPAPMSQDQFMLSRRIYMYGGQVVTE